MAPPRHHTEKPPQPPQPQPEDDDDEEDDYMTMALPAAEEKETPIQRLERQKREARERGKPKSKAELAAEEAARREAAHSRSLLEEAPDKGSKGLAMMAKMGFRGGALGKSRDGVTEPIRVFVKGDRGGVGLHEEKRKREREEEDAALKEMKARKIGEGEYRERVARERETERTERQYRAAAKLAQQLHEQKEEDAATSKPDPTPTESEIQSRKSAHERPLRTVNILWRPLVKEREQAERDRAARRALDEGLTKLPNYTEDLDADDKLAVGEDTTEYIEGDDEEEHDKELEEFEALEPAEKLMRALEYLRKEHRYCFWCKSGFEDEEMDGCPGVTEEDHD